MDSVHSESVSDDLPPLWHCASEPPDLWETVLDKYLRRLLLENFASDTPGGADVLFTTLVEHERIRPQPHDNSNYYNYFLWIARRIVTLAEEMPGLEGQAPALARLYCLVANEGERRGGQAAVDEFWRFSVCDDTVALRRDKYTIHLPLTSPGFWNNDGVYDLIPDPNFIPPASPAELARFGRDYASAARFWRFLAFADVLGGFANSYCNYQGSMGAQGWYPRHLDQAVVDLAHRHDLDLIVTTLSPLAPYLQDEEAIGQSEWGKDGGLDTIQMFKTDLREVFANETLPDLTRARLAALYEDLTVTPAPESDTDALHWRHRLTLRLRDAPSSLELHAAFLVEMERISETCTPVHDTRYVAALQFADAVFACPECEDHIPVVAHLSSLIVNGAKSGAADLEDDDKMEVRLYENGIRPKLCGHLIRPGYHLVDSHILPDPSWTGTLDFSTLVAYGREYASWLRLWSFLGHLDARIDSPLPQNRFPGHFVLTYWTPDRVRRAMSHPGHHTDLDMLVVGLHPLRDRLADGAEMIDGTKERRDELVDVVKDVILCEHLSEITRARLAEIVEYLEGQP